MSLVQHGLYIRLNLYTIICRKSTVTVLEMISFMYTMHIKIVFRERPFDFYGGGGGGRFSENEFHDPIFQKNIQDRVNSIVRFVSHANKTIGSCRGQKNIHARKHLSPPS